MPSQLISDHKLQIRSAEQMLERLSKEVYDLKSVYPGLKQPPERQKTINSELLSGILATNIIIAKLLISQNERKGKRR